MTNEEMEALADELSRCEWWEIWREDRRFFGPHFVTLPTIMGIKEHFSKTGACRIVQSSKPSYGDDSKPYVDEAYWHIETILNQK